MTVYLITVPAKENRKKGKEEIFEEIKAGCSKIAGKFKS